MSAPSSSRVAAACVDPLLAATIRAVFPAVRNPNPPEKMAFERAIKGDFALVARKAKLLDDLEPRVLVAMLADEAAAKAGGERRRIAF